MKSRGEITIPARLRALLNLKPGDKLEFYMNRAGCVLLRPCNASSSVVFEDSPTSKKVTTRAMTDDEAIVMAVTRKDRRSRRSDARLSEGRR